METRPASRMMMDQTYPLKAGPSSEYATNVTGPSAIAIRRALAAHAAGL